MSGWLALGLFLFGFSTMPYRHSGRDGVIDMLLLIAASLIIAAVLT